MNSFEISYEHARANPAATGRIGGDAHRERRRVLVEAGDPRAAERALRRMMGDEERVVQIFRVRRS